MVIEGTSRNQEDSEKTLVMLKKSPPGTGPRRAALTFRGAMVAWTGIV